MDRRIYKFPFEVHDEVKMPMPKGAEILAFEEAEAGLLVLWAIVDTHDTELEDRWFVIRGTGHHLDPGLNSGTYLATTNNPRTPYVWHIFERK